MPLGGTAKCPKCFKPVYFADETSAKGKKWHKSCLSCCLCSKALDSFSLHEHAGDLYCKSCSVKAANSQASGGQIIGEPRSSSDRGLGDEGEGGVRARSGCPRCGRAVYFAEEKLAFGKKWHKMCFKCAECNKLLDSSSVAEREGEAFCKGCYGKLYGPKGYGFAGGSAGLSANMDARYSDGAALSNSFAEAQVAPLLRRQSTLGNGPLCPRCGTTIYFAEEVIAVGSKWHKLCLKCVVCAKLLDSGAVQEHMGAPHCKACYGKVHGPKGYGFGGVGAGLSANQGDEPSSNSRPTSYAEAQVAPLLRRQSTLGSGPVCPSCGTTVYFAEEVIAVGSKWHKLCLKCVVCAKLLDSGAVQEHMGAPHCKTCYGKKHGPRGYGFGGVGAGLSANREDDSADVEKPSSYAEAQAAPLLRRQSTLGNGPLCQGCGTTVYFAEEVSAIGSKWHKLCLKCDVCAKLLDGGSVQEHLGVPHCKTCYGKKHGPRGYGFGGVGAGLSANREDDVVQPNGGTQSPYAEAQVPPLLRKQSSISGGPICPRCGTGVYFAEEVIAAGKKWHKLCLKCGSCSKLLDGGSVQEHDGMPYCRTCYGRQYGSIGYGSFVGGGAGFVVNREDDGFVGSESYSQAGDQHGWPQPSVASSNGRYSDDDLRASMDRLTWHDNSGDAYEAMPAAPLSCCVCERSVADDSAVEWDGDIYCFTCYNTGDAGLRYKASLAETSAADVTNEWL